MNMSYKNGISYTDFRAINLKAEGGIIRFEDITTAPTTTSGEMVLYVDGTTLYFDNGVTITALGASGSSPGVSWESMYAADNTINIAGGNGLTVAGAMSNVNDVFTVSNTAAGSGSVIQISNSGTGVDIRGTAGTWSITKGGVATFAEVVLTSTVSTDVLAVTNNTITANNVFIVSGSGVFTGTGANSFANVTASGLTTGSALAVIANGATTSIGVFTVSATGQTSGSTVLVTGGGANITAGGKVIEVDMGAAITGAGVSITTSGIHAGATTNSLLAINATSLTTGTAIYVQVNGLTTGVAQLITSSGVMTTTGSLLTLTGNSATTAAGLFRVDANGLTSGIAAVIASSATAITGAGRLLRVDHTGATSTSGILSEFASAANDETVIVKITASSLLAAGIALDISAAAMTTGKGIDMSDLDAITTGKAIHVDATGVSQTSGILVHLDSAGTVITGAGRIFLSDHTGITTTSGILNEFKTAATDETIVVQVTTAAMIDGVALKLVGTTGMTTGSLLLATSSTAGALATNGVIALQATGNFTSTSAVNGGFVEVQANTTTAGTVVNVIGTSLTTGIALQLSNGTSGMTSGSLLRVTASGTGTVATNGIVSITHGGIFVSTSNAGVLDVRASAMVGTLSNGTLVNFMTTAAAQVDTTVLNVENSGFTTGYTGSMLRVKSPTTTGACKVVDIIADGITSGGIAVNISVTALTTGDALVITNGTSAITTGSLIKVSASGTGAIATDGIVSFLHAGIYTSTTVGFVNVDASATTAGTVMTVTGALVTGGTGLQLSNAAITTGKHFNVLGAAGASHFSISVKGATVIAGDALGTAALTITAGNLVVTSGNLTVAVGGITCSAPTGNGIGYATGAGGAVTQITSRTTGVTINKLTGTITTVTTSLAAEAAAAFVVTNSTVAIGDTVIVSQQSGAVGAMTDVVVVAVAAGSFTISVMNNNVAAGTAETGAILINFAVIKAVSA